MNPILQRNEFNNKNILYKKNGGDIEKSLFLNKK
jgi:hypothetical protein